MNTIEIKDAIRDMVNAMVKNEPEDQERAGNLIRDVIRQKASSIITPPVEEVESVEKTPEELEADAAATLAAE
jgi:hypothetical protein